MADGFTVSMTGLGEVLAKFGTISEIAHTEIYLATNEAAKQCYEWSQAQVPVLTGALKISGIYDVTENGNNIEGTVSYGDSTVDYAIFQELGTSRLPAQPFLYPAYLDALSLWQKDLQIIALGEFFT